MNFLIAMVLVMFFCFGISSTIKIYANALYIVAGLISFIEIGANLGIIPTYFSDAFYPMFAHGIVSMALLTVVMYGNVFDDRSHFSKTVMPIRKELSIIASILALGHNFTVGLNFINAPHRWSNMTTFTAPLIITTSSICVILLISLLVTSIDKVHNKMDRKKWKSIQKSSYIIYLLIFLQIFLVCIPLAFEGEELYVINSIVYIATFLGYVTLRLRKANKIAPKKKYIYLLAGAYAMVILIVILSWIFTEKEIEVISPTTGSETSSSTSNNSNSNNTNTNTNTMIGGSNTNNSSEDDDKSDSGDNSNDNSGNNSTITIGGVVYNDDDSDDDLEQLLSGEFSIYEDGVYVGSGMGKFDLIVVQITIENNQLVEILIIENDETPERIALTDVLIDDILSQQSLDVDTVSTATRSSNGIKDGIRDALSTANVIS